MNALELLRAHKYAESIEECQRALTIDPGDIAATDTMVSALRAVGKYLEALPFFKRVGAYERADKRLPGRPGRNMDIACLHWMLGTSRQRSN
jgi:hypothetical protein